MLASSSEPPVVLLVEDQVLVRMTAHDLLSDAGFHVIEAANGEEALRVLQARLDVMVVVTDIEMGNGITGLDLARRVAERSPNIGLLLTSGRMMPSADELPVGTVFLAKPYPHALLVEQVRQLAQRVTLQIIEGTEEPQACTIVPMRANDA
jgi:CheY-like chemotaxis protein